MHLLNALVCSSYYRTLMILYFNIVSRSPTNTIPNQSLYETNFLFSFTSLIKNKRLPPHIKINVIHYNPFTTHFIHLTNHLQLQLLPNSTPKPPSNPLNLSSSLSTLSTPHSPSHSLPNPCAKKHDTQHDTHTSNTSPTLTKIV